MRDFNNIKIRFLILSAADISLHYNTNATEEEPSGENTLDIYSKINFWEKENAENFSSSSSCHWRIKVCLVIFLSFLWFCINQRKRRRKNFKLREIKRKDKIFLCFYKLDWFFMHSTSKVHKENCVKGRTKSFVQKALPWFHLVVAWLMHFTMNYFLS